MNAPCKISKILADAKQISRVNDSIQRIQGLEYVMQKGHAYLPRAVSTLPKGFRNQFVDPQYDLFVKVVQFSGLTPRLPVELKDFPNDQVNDANHKHLYESQLIVPFVYMTPDGQGASDGRGWEMGRSYLHKVVVPVVYRSDAGKYNIPSIRLDFQLPVIVDSMGKDGSLLGMLLLELSGYDVGTGVCSHHGRTLIGSRGDQDYVCLKGVTENFLEIVPNRDF